MQKYNKAIAAFVGFVGTFAAAHWGLQLSPEMTGGLATLIGTVLTFVFPNKEA